MTQLSRGTTGKTPARSQMKRNESLKEKALKDIQKARKPK
jgi:hypothetical protein